MPTPKLIYQKRAPDGRYDHHNDWDRLCVCGHRFGIHSAGSPAECLAGTNPPGDPHTGFYCDCRKFKPTGKRRDEDAEVAAYASFREFAKT